MNSVPSCRSAPPPGWRPTCLGQLFPPGLPKIVSAVKTYLPQWKKNIVGIAKRQDIERAVAAECARWARKCDFFQSIRCRRHLENAAPGDCQDRAHRGWPTHCCIVTNFKGPSQSIYDGTYCARG